jgi:DNA-directed RNA polymerase III subunit RPC7
MLTHLPVRELLPPELHGLVTDGDDPTVVSEARAKKLAFLKKSRIDKLAQFDEGADVDAAEDDDDDAKDGDGDGEDDIEEASDNNFSDDDSDMADDYNAENYFENGEDDDDGGGGDEGGGEDW